MRKKNSETESFSIKKSYGTTETKKYEEEEKKPKKEEIIYNNYQSEEKIENKVGSIKTNYYKEARERDKEENGSWFYDVLQDMINYIYVNVLGNDVETKSDSYIEPEYKLDEETKYFI
jgi:hypothetical protein